MHHPRILVVDDDPAIIKFVRANLKADDYETLAALDGAEAIEVVEREMPDLVILDIMLPRIDGFEVLSRLREWCQIPIIVLSARGDAEDKVKCLDLGADDYLSKPFDLEELLARIRAVFRRTEAAGMVPTQPSLSFGELEVNFAQRLVTVAGKEAKLTPTEYALLKELVLNKGKVLTHLQLLGRVWGPEYRDEKDYLHTFIRRIRAKIEPEPAAPRHIISVPGVGYQFKE